MTNQEIDNLVLTAAGVEIADQAVTIGVMKANGQIVFSNFGSPRGRQLLWESMNLSQILGRTQKITVETGRREV